MALISTMKSQLLSVALIIEHSFIFWQLDCIGKMSQKRNHYWQQIQLNTQWIHLEKNASSVNLVSDIFQHRKYSVVKNGSKKAVWSISRYVCVELPSFLYGFIGGKAKLTKPSGICFVPFFQSCATNSQICNLKKKSRFFLLYALLCFHFVISVCQKNFKSALK